LELFGAEIARRPAARKLLANEPELRADPRRLTELEQECFLADHVIAASEFTRHSLIHAGLDPGRISVVPYGVDTRLFPRVADDGSRGGPIRVLFVGQISQRKGILDLLEAWRDCGTQRRSLTLVGRGASALLEAGAPAGIRAFEHLGSSELVQALASHDVLCLPSIAEGFGLVIMEALACGTPVIASCNTGGADVLSDGVDGFILRAGDVPALRSLLSDLAGDPSKVRGMRLAAQLKAESYSWEKFREDIVTVIQRTERDWKSRSQGHGQSRAQPSSDATGRPKGGGSVVDCLGQGAARMKGQLP
jgi:glycosyltransferase involved in cell wall biosynthesis